MQRKICIILNFLNIYGIRKRQTFTLPSAAFFNTFFFCHLFFYFLFTDQPNVPIFSPRRKYSPWE